MTADRMAEAVAVLKALSSDGTVPRSDLPYDEVLAAPQRYLGPFSALPASLQLYLIRFYRTEEEVRTLASGPLSHSLICGGAVLSRILYRSEHLAARVQARTREPWKGRAGRVRRWLRRTARQSTHLPFILRRWLHRAGAWLRLHTGRPQLATVLRASGFDDRPLGAGYLDGLRQLPGCISVLKRPQAAVTYAQLVGLDFVRSGGIHWFLEANCNPVLMDARLALHTPGGDPWVNNMLRCVLTRGYRRLITYGYRPFPHGHGVALIEAGRRLGVDVKLIDDFFFRRHPGHERAWLMHNGASDAFVVRAKTFDVLFDRAVLSKQQTRQIIDQAPVDWAAAGVALPPLVCPGQQAPHYQPDSRFPNIVAKRDDLDRGAGVSFYKLPRVPAKADCDADYFEEYRVPDPCPFQIVRGQQRALPGGAQNAWKIRSYALLTPEGAEYLSSIKVISGVRVPDHLPDGRVARKNIYLATINEGGVYSAVTSDEEEVYRRIVTVVGGALLHWLRLKHGPDFNDHAGESLTR
ncbi:MAG: hypothetical protein ACE5I7_00625 [Candidatus Binatia bacterium]